MAARTRIVRLGWRGRAITAEVRLCQRDRYQQVVGAGGGLVLIAKGIQPIVAAELRLPFDPRSCAAPAGPARTADP